MIKGKKWFLPLIILPVTINEWLKVKSFIPLILLPLTINEWLKVKSYLTKLELPIIVTMTVYEYKSQWGTEMY